MDKKCSNIADYKSDDVEHGIPNIDTLAAIAEVQEMKRDPNKKTYGSFAELVAEISPI